MSVVGVYAASVDKFPTGVAVDEGPTIRATQQHGQQYVERLLEHVERGEIDPSYPLTHRWPPDRGREGDKMFKHKSDNCVRVVFDPRMQPGG